RHEALFHPRRRLTRIGHTLVPTYRCIHIASSFCTDCLTFCRRSKVDYMGNRVARSMDRRKKSVPFVRPNGIVIVHDNEPVRADRPDSTDNSHPRTAGPATIGHPSSATDLFLTFISPGG